MAKIKKTRIWVAEDKYYDACRMLEKAGINTWNQVGAFTFDILTCVITLAVSGAVLTIINLLN